eukprot:3375004-Amphidinium_carterae.1
MALQYVANLLHSLKHLTTLQWHTSPPDVKGARRRVEAVEHLLTRMEEDGIVGGYRVEARLSRLDSCLSPSLAVAMMATILASGEVEAHFQTFEVPIPAYLARCRAVLAHYSAGIQGDNSTPLDLTDPLTAAWLRLKQILGITMPEDLLLNQPYLEVGKSSTEQNRLSTLKPARARAQAEARTQRALALGERHAAGAEAARQAVVAGQHCFGCLAQNGRALHHAAKELRSDHSIVLAAVSMMAWQPWLLEVPHSVAHEWNKNIHQDDQTVGY